MNQKSYFGKFRAQSLEAMANKTLEIGNMKNENQKLADLEQEYLEKLKNTHASEVET